MAQLPLLDDYLLSLQSNNYSHETVYNYERDLAVFQHFLDAYTQDFSHLSKKDIEQYKAYLRSNDRQTAKSTGTHMQLSAETINRHLSVLRSYLRFLVDMDHPSPLSPDAIKLIKRDKKHPRVAELTELIRVIEAPQQYESDERVSLRNRAMLETLFSTGMRISELISLNRTHIDDSGRVFIKGKGKKERFVYLTPRALYHINRYLKIRKKDTDPALFVPYRGRNVQAADVHKRRVSPNYLQAKIKKYRELLHINVPISAHTLRHGFATYLAEGGANAAAIQILLGHESLDTTTRYVHASDRFAEKAHTDYHPLRKKDGISANRRDPESEDQNS